MVLILDICNTSFKKENGKRPNKHNETKVICFLRKKNSKTMDFLFCVTFFLLDLHPIQFTKDTGAIDISWKKLASLKDICAGLSKLTENQASSRGYALDEANMAFLRQGNIFQLLCWFDFPSKQILWDNHASHPIP